MNYAMSQTVQNTKKTLAGKPAIPKHKVSTLWVKKTGPFFIWA